MSDSGRVLRGRGERIHRSRTDRADEEALALAASVQISKRASQKALNRHLQHAFCCQSSYFRANFKPFSRAFPRVLLQGRFSLLFPPQHAHTYCRSPSHPTIRVDPICCRHASRAAPGEEDAAGAEERVLEGEARQSRPILHPPPPDLRACRALFTPLSAPWPAAWLSGGILQQSLPTYSSAICVDSRLVYVHKVLCNKIVRSRVQFPLMTPAVTKSV